MCPHFLSQNVVISLFKFGLFPCNPVCSLLFSPPFSRLYECPSDLYTTPQATHHCAIVSKSFFSQKPQEIVAVDSSSRGKNGRKREKRKEKEKKERVTACNELFFLLAFACYSCSFRTEAEKGRSFSFIFFQPRPTSTPDRTFLLI